MIDQQTVDRIFDAADIVSVVSDYVSLKRRGANYWGNCPFHDEKTPSFSVSPAKNIYKCFGCGKGGNAVNFIMGVENLSYYEALKFLAKKFNIEIKEKELTQEQKEQQNERESLMSLTEWAHKHFIENLQTSEGQAVGMSYFAHRGFREDTIKKFQLGYALERRDEYTKAALAKGYKLDFLEKTGLTIVKDNNYQIDRFFGRAIFPIHSISGRVIAFGGRAIKKDEVAKYQNSPESDIYHKSTVLFGLFFAKKAITQKKKCYIVEGYCDVISMMQAGVENIVAPCGTALTTQQIQQLRRILPSADAERSEDKYVTLLYDGDAAGMHAALKNGKLLLEEGLNVRVVVLPEPEDPDSFAQGHESSEVIRYLEENEQDYIVFKIKHYWDEAVKDPIKMAQLTEDVASTIEVIPEPVKRSIYAKTAANMLGVEEAVLLDRINALNRKRLEEAAGPNLADRISKSQSIEPEPTVAPTNLQPQSWSENVERDLIQCLVRFGNMPIVVKGENENGEDVDVEVPIVQYIKEDLDADGFVLNNNIYQQMLDEYWQRYQESGISSEEFFQKNVNAEFVEVASTVISDPYPLSRIFDKDSNSRIKAKALSMDDPEVYCKEVLYALNNFKSTWLQHEIDDRMERLKSLTDNDMDKLQELLTEIKNLKDVQRDFDKMLGERHIRP